MSSGWSARGRRRCRARARPSARTGPAAAETRATGCASAVVEYHNVRNTGDLSGQVVQRAAPPARWRTALAARPSHLGRGRDRQPERHVAGVAPGADIVSRRPAGSARASPATARSSRPPTGRVARWRRRGHRQCQHRPGHRNRRGGGDVATSTPSRWEDGRLVVAAAGNSPTFGHWDIAVARHRLQRADRRRHRRPRTRPAAATTGSGTRRRTARPTATGRAPRGTRTATYNKPNVSAPAVSVQDRQRASSGSGTSIACPIVAGIAAQLIARAPTLAPWPEATRALHHGRRHRRTPMPERRHRRRPRGRGDRVGDAGRTASSTTATGRSAGHRRAADLAGRRSCADDRGGRPGSAVRASLAWSSHTSGDSNTGKADVLMADLDLRSLRQPNGAVVGSYSFDNPYERVDFMAGATGTMRIEVRRDRGSTRRRSHSAWRGRSSGPFTDADALTVPLGHPVARRAEGITSGCCSDALTARTASVTRGPDGDRSCGRALGLPRDLVGRLASTMTSRVGPRGRHQRAGGRPASRRVRGGPLLPDAAS